MGPLGIRGSQVQNSLQDVPRLLSGVSLGPSKRGTWREFGKSDTALLLGFTYPCDHTYNSTLSLQTQWPRRHFHGILEFFWFMIRRHVFFSDEDNDHRNRSRRPRGLIVFLSSQVSSFLHGGSLALPKKIWWKNKNNKKTNIVWFHSYKASKAVQFTETK